MTGDAALDFARLRSHATRTFKGNVVLFAGPDEHDSLTIIPFGLGDAAFGLIIQPCPPPTPEQGESEAEAARRLMESGQRDDQVVLIFPHPFDAINGLLQRVTEGMNMYVEHNLAPEETPDEWELAETTRITHERMQLRRHVRTLLQALADQNRSAARRAINALRPLAGFTEGTFSQFDTRRGADFATPEQDRRERDAAHAETGALRDGLIDALGIQWDAVQPDDQAIIAAARAAAQTEAQEAAQARRDAARWYAAAEATCGPERDALFKAHLVALTLADTLNPDGDLAQQRAHLARARQEHPHAE